ncbi:hypothetical protein SLEP1_g14872 [Rubroshorea leprosula]|uniref:Biotin carboxyl carrier protein of acetyl-CoA carboxylase n=1 Tax=Rubroshorea leprosula TaxID=152421 RepID=A0AAV5IKJ7_9ROSI|nr:hypothetical protein SLEP1_g14872 [Rubroshorea leprosula]
MSSSLSTPFSASFSTAAIAAGNSTQHSIRSLSNLSFRLSPNPRIPCFSKGLNHSQNSSAVMKAQLNEVCFIQRFSLEDLFSNFCTFLDNFFGSSVASKVAVDNGSSNAAPAPPAKSGEPAAEAKDSMTSSDTPPALATEESISEFLTQVSSLVKLVDSRDIVELQLKQLDCELIIRKKEALPQLPCSAPDVVMHSSSTLPAMPPTQTAPAPAPSVSAPSSPPPRSTTSVAPKSAKSLLPPLKCPMAGTFYRSPAPGEPPFVKVGDKVQKRQILCIIEAMKLMNEIEADRSGTIVEIPVEDCRPVSVEQPLLVIEP